MATETATTEYTIDAKGKRLGVVASEAASVLLGKRSAAVTKHTVADVQVYIINAGLLDIPERKRHQFEYRTYSGYPGGLKKEKREHLITRRGYVEIVRRTVAGMLPKNRLHKLRLHNLHISE